MNNEEFEKIFDQRVATARALLVEKAKEYADDKDRMHNFHVAAKFESITPSQALWGMATKHFVSLSDMIHNSDVEYDPAQWDEKLGDAINYLFLLDALLHEEEAPVPTDFDPVVKLEFSQSITQEQADQLKEQWLQRYGSNH